MLKTLSDYGNAIRTARQGGCSLPAAAHSVLLSRFKYGLGPQFHSIFELWNKPAASWKDFIVSDEVNARHKAASHAEDKRLTDDKIAFTTLCVANALPTIPVICAIDRKANLHIPGILNGLAFKDWQAVMNTGHESIFIKPIDGISGKGAFSARRTGNDWEYLGKTGGDHELHKYCVENIEGKRGWIVQPQIRPQAEVAQKFSPRALSTVRMVTYMNEGAPKLLFAALRIPVGESNTDNWSLGLSGNLVAPIDTEDGTLGSARTSRSKTWPMMFATDTHPDTGERIKGYTLPNWQAAKELAIRAQEVFQQIPTLGWDIALTDTGPIIVETNWNYGVELIEVALQRGIRQDLAPTFSYPRRIERDR